MINNVSMLILKLQRPICIDVFKKPTISLLYKPCFEIDIYKQL